MSCTCESLPRINKAVMVPVEEGDVLLQDAVLHFTIAIC